MLILLLAIASNAINTNTSNNRVRFTTAGFPLETFKGVMKIRTFTSPDCSFDAVIQALNSANVSVFIEMYSFSNPFILDVLKDLSSKGVNIRIILQKHHVSSFENEYTFWAAYQLNQSGAHVYWANETEFRYTHAKFVIIDNKTVLIESENWAKSGIPKDPTYGNRGWGVIIENNALADYFLDVFLYDLSLADPYGPEEEPGTPVSYAVSSGNYEPHFSLHTYNEYVEVTPVLSPDFSEELIIDLINSANETIYIEQMYIYSDLTGIIDALINAKQKGVDVRIILDPRSSENNETAEILTQHGIWVAYANTSYYGSPYIFVTMHNKGVIVDGKIVLISSINWSPTSLRENREVGVLIKNEHVAQYYEEIFNYDWQLAAEILYGEAPQPSPGPSIPSGIGIIALIAIIIIIIGILIARRR